MLDLAIDESRDVLWARSIAAPFGASRPRRLPLKIGLRYERACREAVKNAVAAPGFVIISPWFSYQYRGGDGGICQPDILVLKPALVVVIECKNTWAEIGWEQIELYTGVANAVYGKRAVGLQMCKNITHRTHDVIRRDLEDAIGVALAGRRVTLHWSGKGTL